MIITKIKKLREYEENDERRNRVLDEGHNGDIVPIGNMHAVECQNL